MRACEGMKIAKAKGHLPGKQPKLKPRQEAHLVSLFEGGSTPPPSWPTCSGSAALLSTEPWPATTAAPSRRCNRRRPQSHRPVRRPDWHRSGGVVPQVTPLRDALQTLADVADRDRDAVPLPDDARGAGRSVKASLSFDRRFCKGSGLPAVYRPQLPPALRAWRASTLAQARPRGSASRISSASSKVNHSDAGRSGRAPRRYSPRKCNGPSHPVPTP